MNYAIKVSNITKKYNLYKRPQDRLKEIFSFTKKSYHDVHYALKDISFCVEKGETIGIIGKNGAGKSTLLKLITGVSTPSSGIIEVHGQVAALLELGTGFNPEYSGYENIYLNGTMRGFTKAEMDAKIKDIIEFADIGDYIEQPVKTYSSGMFARLAFSVMVSFKPEILIVDEALSVGDVFFQQKCNTYMKEEMKDVTKLLVTHDMNSIVNMADRVILIDNGKIVKIGPPLEVTQLYLQMMHTETFASIETKNEKKDYKEVDDNRIGCNDDDWISVKKSDLGGAGDVIISACLMKINDEKINIAKHGDLIKFYYKVEAKKTIKNIITGYTVKDKYGNIIFGQNTTGSGLKAKGVEEGKQYIFEIQVKWPEVKEGDYFITLGIGEGTDQMLHTIQCWAHNILHIKSIELVPMHGIINNKINKINQYEI